MRNRVALAATLITLSLLIVLASLICVNQVKEYNEQLSGELELACTLVAESEPSGNKESFIAISQYLQKRDISICMYSSDGQVIYTTTHDFSSLTETEMDMVAKGESSAYETEGSDGETILCALDILDNGTYIKATADSFGFFEVLTRTTSSVIATLFLVLSMVFCLVLIILNSNRSKAVKHVMKVLDSFADGRFSARFSKASGFTQEDLEEYNAILERIDERIFKQRSSNQALSAVMNNMQNGIIAVDDKLKVMLITPVAKQLLGISGDPQGIHISDASSDVKLDQILMDAMQQGGVYMNEVAAHTAVGRGHRPLRLYISSIQKENRTVGALAMVEDITELRRLEQVRTDFAANVSHELKTPLTSIRGFVETLLDGAIDHPEMAKKFLNIILMEAERLTRLINDILSISKMESGQNDAPKERLRLDKMAFDVTEMLSIHARDKQITLNQPKLKEPVYIIGNKDHVQQMLINLVENGIKYNTPGGSVTVQVFASATSANLSVADTGIGIAEEHKGRLFERFYRVDKGRSRSMGGTGLGLAIVKHIVKSMKGEIELQSKLGEGTEFLVSIPLAPPPKDDDYTDEDIRQEDIE